MSIRDLTRRDNVNAETGNLLPAPTFTRDVLGRSLDALLRVVRSGAAFEDQATAERMAVALVSTLSELRAQHPKDNQGRCLVCYVPPRGWRWWPKTTSCTVDDALSAFVSPAWEAL
jgi:hypothetical protein